MNISTKSQLSSYKICIPRSINSTTWQNLIEHFNQIRHQSMQEWFLLDQNRGKDFTYSAANITIDFSKNLVTRKTIELLMQLVKESNLTSQRHKLFLGEKLNLTENRSVLHTLLRCKENIDVIRGKKAKPGIGSMNAKLLFTIQETLKKMCDFSNRIHNGTHRGFSGKPINHIVNIGIGGSDLGPKMIIDALKGHPNFLGSLQLSIDFVSNIDGSEVDRICRTCNPETTLFIIVSKTFKTQETLSNAITLRKWLLDSGCLPHQLNQNMIAISANKDEVKKFGISIDNTFDILDGVGGRYSLWSAVGLSIMLVLGINAFTELLDGARAMDEHFLNAHLDENLPVLLALIGIWYRNFYNCQTVLIAPYFQSLHYFPQYLQQLEMESTGKSTNINNERIQYSTAPIIWGETGTNGQHAFFQMLHQGTTLVPIDFIAVLKPNHKFIDHHRKLLANCFAQSEALMLGKAKSVSENTMSAHMQFDGNKPSTTILLNACDPHSLGALIALYEHKVFVQSQIWNINPFDQFGVELGKQLSQVIELELISNTKIQNTHDSSTNSLINFAKETLNL